MVDLADAVVVHRRSIHRQEVRSRCPADSLRIAAHEVLRELVRTRSSHGWAMMMLLPHDAWTAFSRASAAVKARVLVPVQACVRLEKSAVELK